MPHSRRTPRLLAVAMLVTAGLVAVVPPAAGAEKPLAGIDRPALVALCERYQGRLIDKVQFPFGYGCELTDGQISCLETAECSFRRLDDRPPIQESCERARGEYGKRDVATYSCWTEQEEFLVVCTGQWTQDCLADSEPHEQPMPRPAQGSSFARTRDASA